MSSRNGNSGKNKGLQVVDVPIAKVIPYARNPRRNAGAVAKVAASLNEFGWRQPIVVGADMVVIVGHTRLLAARQLGMETVPVHIATGLTAAQVKAYRIADNRTGEEAEWDRDLLALEFGDLKELDFDLSLTGFGEAELKGFGAKPAASHPALGDVEYQLVVSLADEQEQGKLCAELEERGYACRPLML